MCSWSHCSHGDVWFQAPQGLRSRPALVLSTPSCQPAALLVAFDQLSYLISQPAELTVAL